MTIIKINRRNLSAFSLLLNPGYLRQIQSGTLEAFGAVSEGVAAGILVFGVKQEGVFLLHEVIVAPPYQRKGIASELLTWFTQLSLDEGALILTSFDDEEDSAARKMLHRCGFKMMDSVAKNYVVTFEKLREMTALDHIKYVEQVKPIAVEEQFLWKRFCREQEEQKNALLSVSYMPEAAQELNLCIRSGTKLAGCVIGNRLSEEQFELSHACVGEKQPWALMPLLAVFRRNLLEMGKPSARLHMTAVTDVSARLMEKLLPEGYTCVGRKQAVFGK